MPNSMLVYTHINIKDFIMATVYFDIKKSEFYTETRELYPYSFTEVGTTIKTRLESYITSVDQFHIGTIGNVISFNLTDANANAIKISAAPFEVTKSTEDPNVFIIKYGYAAMIPYTVLNAEQLFRMWVYDLGQAQKIRKLILAADHIKLKRAFAYYIPVVDITQKKNYNTFSAVAVYTVKKTS